VGPVQPDDKHGAVHKNALDMVEWEMLLLQGLAAAHKVSKVLFPVRRLSWFYMQNIVLMMFILTSLGLLALSMDVSSLGS
jgi:hypothetical protein